MAKDRTKDPIVRKNVSLRKSAIAIGEALTDTLHKSSFSQLLTDLLQAAHDRQSTGGGKTREQCLVEIVELLAQNRALEAKVEDLRISKSVMKSTFRQHLQEKTINKTQP